MRAAPKTLVELVCERADTHGARGYKFLGNGVDVSESLSFAELDAAARRIAVELRAADVQPGARALLLYAPGLEFVRAYFACFYAGIVAVPVPAPNPARLARTLPRLRMIAEDAGIAVVLTSSDLQSAASAMLPLAPELASQRWIATDLVKADPKEWKAPPSNPEAPALLQYTSGSTGNPRGVQITHANLLHNLSLIRHFFGNQDDQVMVSWLPVYHDMGLIGGMMTPLLDGGDCFMMSPIQFLQDPVKWLAAITKHRGTTTGAPNFAFELCVRKVTAENLKQLDLSSLRIAFCGSEPVRKATMDAFAARFAPAGFRAEALRPCYGLAEATLIVSGALEEGAKSWSVDGDALLAGRVVPETRPDAYLVMGCGRAGGDLDVAIVGETRERCSSSQVGEIWVRGKSVSAGYWNKPVETEATFGATLADGTGPFLRTGDLGFIAPDGGLCIVGRTKDLIIVRGKNYYPHDIEETAEQASPRVRRGASAAFGIDQSDGEGEGVVVVAEADLKTADESTSWEDVVAAVRAAVGEDHELTLHAVQLIMPGQLPKTPSGKVQRALTRKMYRAGELETVHSWKAPPRALTSTRPKPINQKMTAEQIATQMRSWLGEQLGRTVDGDVSFAALGLDSLELVRLTDMLRVYLKQPNLSTSAAIDFPSIETLAVHLAEQCAQQDEDEDEPVAPPLERKNAETGRVLSYWQESVLAWENHRSPSPTWTETARVRLRGRLDAARLADAIRRVAERQDALRQVLFRDGTGGGICSVLDIAVDTIDVAGHTEDAIEELYRAEASKAFPIDGSPLVRFHLLRRGPEDHTLVFAWHQLVHEGTGGPQVLREILETYAARLENRAPNLPELKLRYGDYALWERSYFEGAGRPEVIAAVKRLAHARAVELPTDRPRKGPPSPAPVGTRLAVPAAETARFLELCQSQDATFYAGMVALVGVVVASWAKTQDIVMMSPASTRTRPELNPLFGRFAASTPLLMTLTPNATLGQLMAQVRAQSGVASSGVPAPLVLGSSDVFEHPFNRVIVNTPRPEGAAGELPSSIAGLDVTLEPVWKPLTARNEFIVIARKKENEIVGIVTGYADLFDEATVKRRAEHLVRLMGTATADARVSSLAAL